MSKGSYIAITPSARAHKRCNLQFQNSRAQQHSRRHSCGAFRSPLLSTSWLICSISEIRNRLYQASPCQSSLSGFTLPLWARFKSASAKMSCKFLSPLLLPTFCHLDIRSCPHNSPCFLIINCSRSNLRLTLQNPLHTGSAPVAHHALDAEQDGLGCGLCGLSERRGRGGDRRGNATAGTQDTTAAAGGEGKGGDATSSGEGGW